MDVHTPGPWGYYGKFLVQARPDGSIPINSKCICAIESAVSDADSVLIAAAPDLLAALKAIVNSDMAQREEDEGRASKDLELARAAIAKAEGL